MNEMSMFHQNENPEAVDFGVFFAVLARWLMPQADCYLFNLSNHLLM